LPSLDSIFRDLRASGRTALMPFITAGYPSLQVTEQVIPVLEEAGASVIELGIPFSDPIADGPVIAASMHEALLGGATPAKIFEMVRRLRRGTRLGLVAMVSYSIVDRHGPGRFVADAADAGFDGLIIPDIDLDAADVIRPIADGHNLSLSMLIAPTTTPARMARLVRLCTGFVYLLARVGITGERADAPEIAQRVEALRALTTLPIAAGFGISKAEHVAAVTRVADAAIVGSALVRRMGAARDPVEEARRFVSELSEATVVQMK